MVTETKVIELVIVADHSEVSSPGPAGPPWPRPPRRLSRPPLHPQVQRYPDAQHLVNRTLEVAFLLDTLFRPLNVRVALVGLETWTQGDQIEIHRDPSVTLHNFLRWRRANLLPRLPHDSAQLVT